MEYLEVCKLIDDVFSITTKNTILDNWKTQKETFESILGIKNSDNKQILDFLEKSSKQARLEYFLFDKKERYAERYYIFSEIRGNLRDCDLCKLNDLEIFKKVIEYFAKKYVHQTWELDDSSSKEKTLASILNSSYFRKCNFKIENGTIVYDKIKLQQIALDLEKSIKDIGGLSLLNFYFQNFLIKSYNQNNGRYNLSRPRYDYKTTIIPNFPHNYIIQLCIKNIKKNEKIHPVDISKVKDFLDKISKFCFLYDTQEFFQINALVFPDNYDNDLIYKNSLNDNVYCFKHFSITNFSYNLKKILKPLEEKSNEIDKLLGFSLKEYNNLVSKLYYNACPGIQYFNLKDFPPNEVNIIKNLAHKTRINENFLLPTDFNQSNNPFDSSPFILFDNNDFYIIDLNLSTINFYQVILNKLNWDKNLIDVGKNIENLLTSYCKKFGFKTYEGNYKHSQNRECDLVLESMNDIVFIESKKKTVTTQALSGDRPQLILDLCESFMAAQEQTLFHEKHLREKGELEFNDGRILKYNNQEIHRVSVTLFDLFILNDHYVSENLFKFLRQKSFSISSKKIDSDEYKKLESRLSSINKKMKHLNDFVNELKTKYYSSTMDERMFELNTWFLSFEQVLFLFNKAYSKNISFGEILKSIRTAAFMNGDFYSNYDYLEEIKKAK